jgi:hypothetical protein
MSNFQPLSPVSTIMSTLHNNQKKKSQINAENLTLAINQKGSANAR